MLNDVENKENIGNEEHDEVNAKSRQQSAISESMQK